MSHSGRGNARRATGDSRNLQQKEKDAMSGVLDGPPWERFAPAVRNTARLCGAQRCFARGLSQPPTTWPEPKRPGAW